MTEVVHVRRHAYDVYIGRGIPALNLKASPFANPFIIGLHGSRDQCVDNYEEHLRERLQRLPQLRDQLLAMRGKRLACWCTPARCHGDVLVKLINELHKEAAPSTP